MSIPTELFHFYVLLTGTYLNLSNVGLEFAQIDLLLKPIKHHS